MSARPFKIILLVTSAFAASAIVLSGLITVTEHLTIYSYTPADFLPAEETIALFTHIDPTEREQFSLWFPELAIIEEAPDAIALLKLENGKRGTIIFQKKNSEEEAKDGLGNFLITASDSELESLLTANTPRLQKAKAYATLSTRRSRDAAWIYLKDSSIPKTPLLRERILMTLALGSSSHIALINNGDSITIERYNEKMQSIATINETLRFIESPFIVLQSNDMKEDWETMQSALTNQEQAILKGIMQQGIQTLFGQDISVDYDVLPMITEETTIQISKGNITNILLVAGGMKKSRDLARTIEKMHTSYADTLKTARTTKRTLDKRFNSLDIRSDPSQIENTVEKRRKWNTRLTNQKGSMTGLFTATQGTRYLLSNDKKTLFLAMDKNETVLELPRATPIGTLYAGGRVDREIFGKVMKVRLPGIGGIGSPLTITGAIVWAMENDGSIMTITIK